MSQMDRVQHEAHRLTEKLRTLRDEVRGKAQLAQMEAEEAWEDTTRHIDKTVSQLEELGRAWGASAGEARLQLQLGLMEAQERATLIQNRVEDVWSRLETTGKRVEKKAELAELRTRLGKMETEDFFQEKRARFLQLVETSREKAIDGLQEGLKEVSRRLEDFLDRLR